MEKQKKRAAIMIIAAGICWGMIGFFSKHLSAGGFNSLEITFIRCGVTAVLFWGYIALRCPEKGRIGIKDLWMFLGTGILSITFFNVMYFMCIHLTSLSVAAILLYTAPCIVTVLSALLFHEKMTAQKIGALVLAVFGCACTSGVLDMFVKGGLGTISLLGIVTGLGSGLGYALYTIFGNVALKKYDSLTVTSYTFLIAAVSLAPFCIRTSFVKKLGQGDFILYALAIAVISTLLPFCLYTMGLRDTEPSKASVMAFVEPMVATLIGITVFHEHLTVLSVMGIFLIFFAILLLNGRRRKCCSKNG